MGKGAVGERGGEMLHVSAFITHLREREKKKKKKETRHITM